MIACVLSAVNDRLASGRLVSMATLSRSRVQGERTRERWVGRRRGGEKEENRKQKKDGRIYIEVVVRRCYSVTQEVSEPAWHLPWAGFTGFCYSWPGGQRLLGRCCRCMSRGCPCIVYRLVSVYSPGQSALADGSGSNPEGAI